MTRVVYRSEVSRRVSSWSRSRRHRAAMLLTTSMAESKPNPTRATLPAMNPATSATTHSTEFQPIVRYWSRRPAVTLWARGRETRSSTPAIVSCVHGLSSVGAATGRLPPRKVAGWGPAPVYRGATDEHLNLPSLEADGGPGHRARAAGPAVARPGRGG